jgi:hypothetical protein
MPQDAAPVHCSRLVKVSSHMSQEHRVDSSGHLHTPPQALKLRGQTAVSRRR